MAISATKVQPPFIHFGFSFVSLPRFLGNSVGVDSFLSAPVEEEEYWGLPGEQLRGPLAQLRGGQLP